MSGQIEALFTNRQVMLDNLKKASYERYMDEFRKGNGAYLQELIKKVENGENREEAAKQAAEEFTDGVQAAFAKKGKIKSRTQADINCFMIYYVFPAILLTESECSRMLADKILDLWREKFKNSKIQYASYEEIYNGFQDKIFGFAIR